MLMDKRKILGTVLGSIMFVGVILFLTYAMYVWQSDPTDVVFSINDKYFSCETGIDGGVSGLTSVTDYKSGAYLSFGVDNIGNAATSFSITMLIENESDISEALISEDLKYKIVVDTADNGPNDSGVYDYCVKNECTSVGVLDDYGNNGDFSSFGVGANTMGSAVSVPNNVRYRYYLFIYLAPNKQNIPISETDTMEFTLDVCEVVASLDYNSPCSHSPSYKKLVDSNSDGLIDYGSVLALTAPTRSSITISYNSNGATSTPDSVTPTVPKFEGWYLDSALTSSNKIDSTKTVSSNSLVNHNLYAKWINGGSATLPTVTKTGYTFNGWYNGSTKVGDAGASFNPYTNYCDNLSLSASWTANQIVLSDKTIEISYSESSQTVTFDGAENGTGNYKYSITSGNSNNYFSIPTATATKILVNAETPVATYSLTVKVEDTVSGSVDTATITIKVNKVDAVCPTLTAYSDEYDGKAHGITVSGGSGGTIQYRTSTTGTWSTTKPTITNVSESPITTYVQVSGDSNHNTKDCGSAEVTINAYNLSNATISGLSDKTYTGSAITQAPTVKVPIPSGSTTTLTNDTDYTYATTNNTNVGTATVTVTGQGNYTGTKTATFKIAKYESNTASITCDSLTYNAAEQTLIKSGTATFGSIYYSVGTDLTSSNYSSKGSTTKPKEEDAGDYTVYYYVPGTDNYNAVDSSITCSIAKYNLSNATISGLSDKTYTGSAITQAPTVKVLIPSGSTTTLTNNTDYTYATTNNTNVGTATVTVTGKGNYTGTKTATFEIGKASVTVPTSPSEKTYNGENQSSGITTPTGASVVTDSSTTSAKNAGTYTVVYQLTSTSNYQWSDGTTTNKSVTWMISPYNLSNATISGLSDKTYTGSAITQAPTVKVPIPSGSTTTLTNNTDYTYATTNNTNVGTATVTVTGKGNYTGTKTATFEIGIASTTITLTKINAAGNVTYDGEVHSASATASSGATVTLKYYTNSSCTINTTTANSGASATNGAPKYAGSYYVTGTSPATTNYDAGTLSCTYAGTISEVTTAVSISISEGSVELGQIDSFTVTVTADDGASIFGILEVESYSESYYTLSTSEDGAYSEIIEIDATTGNTYTIYYKGTGITDGEVLYVAFYPNNGTNYDYIDNSDVYIEVTADVTKPTTPTITRSDYNTFTYSSTDSVGVTCYYVSKSSSTPAKPTNTCTTSTATTYDTWTTTKTKDINGAGTYYVWAVDAAGNVSSSKSITAYTISRSQGTGTTLTTNYDSTSSSTGTSFASDTAVLAGTPIWAKVTANTGYGSLTLKHGTTSMTTSGGTFNVSASETITSSAKVTTTITTSVSEDEVELGKINSFTVTVTAGDGAAISGTLEVESYDGEYFTLSDSENGEYVSFLQLDATTGNTYTIYYKGNSIADEEVTYISFYSSNDSYIDSYNSTVYITVTEDVSKPVATITSTNIPKSSTQTATLTCTDEVGVTAYYWGTTAPTSTSTYTALESATTKMELEIEINTSTGMGYITYYLSCKDVNENVSITVNKSYRVFDIMNMLLQADGEKGTYTSSEYDIISMYRYIYSGNYSYSDFYTIPDGASASTFVGMSWDVLSSTSSADISTVEDLEDLGSIVPVTNGGNIMWFDRIEHTVSYNTNGGSGVFFDVTKRYGATLTLSTKEPTRSGYNFLGWSTSYTATTATYQPGGSYTLNTPTNLETNTTILYAVWEDDGSDCYVSNLGDSQVYLYPTLIQTQYNYYFGSGYTSSCIESLNTDGIALTNSYTFDELMDLGYDETNFFEDYPYVCVDYVANSTASYKAVIQEYEGCTDVFKITSGDDGSLYGGIAYEFLDY